MTGPLLLREQTKLSVYAQVTRGTRIVTILGSVYSEVNIEGVAITCVSFSSLSVTGLPLTLVHSFTNMLKQGGIPVGCVPPAFAVQTGDRGRVYRGVSYPLDIYP